jgi:hypothetical protein
MGTPVLFVVDEDRTALEALAADLDRRFGADYQILARALPDGGTDPAWVAGVLLPLVAAAPEWAIWASARVPLRSDLPGRDAWL